MKKISIILAILASLFPVLVSAAPYIVDQGGTGTSTFPVGQLLVGNGKSPVQGTSTPSVASITVTNGSATSTFAGNVKVSGNLQVDGNFFAPVSLVSSGNATINGNLTVTGVSRLADGAVGTPSYSFTNDTNTGIYSGGADILKLVTGGSDRLTINASGNVGIGTTTSTSALSVYGTAKQPLYVSRTNGGVLAQFHDSGYNNDLSLQSNSTSGITFTAGAADGISFALNNNSNPDVIFDRYGNVGIGTTNPSQKLEVNGGVRYNTATAKPTCDSTVRGTTWFTQGAPGVKDTFEVCAKDAADAYAWRTLY